MTAYAGHLPGTNFIIRCQATSVQGPVSAKSSQDKMICRDFPSPERNPPPIMRPPQRRHSRGQNGSNTGHSARLSPQAGNAPETEKTTPAAVSCSGFVPGADPREDIAAVIRSLDPESRRRLAAVLARDNESRHGPGPRTAEEPPPATMVGAGLRPSLVTGLVGAGLRPALVTGLVGAGLKPAPTCHSSSRRARRWSIPLMSSAPRTAT